MSSTIRSLIVTTLAVALAACASDATSKLCPTTGIVCPEDKICAAAQAVCLVSSCGNGQVDSGEQCDDGNIIDGDRCSSLCRNEVCGNGIVDVGEDCDPVPGNAVGGDGCSEICTIESCGNGRRDVGEECDDGNLDNGDGCTGTPIEISDGAGGTRRSPEPCTSTEVCGNGIVDFQVGEVCDDHNTTSGDGCNSDCRSGEGCGNGILDPGEECDDGNNDDHDRCLNSCKLSQCGDGVVESTTSPGVPPRETCDPGDPQNPFPIETADCNIDCTISTCGDRRVNTTDGEECDAGTGQNLDSNNCTSECKFNFCGDGKKDTQVPNTEACDDGNTNNFDGCSNACQLATCGNMTVDVGEDCDDGNTNNNDLCVACKNAKCGDGWVQSGVEECDGDGAGTGDQVAGDGCSITCRVERCGNSSIDPGETCDDGQNPVTDPPSTTASPNPTAPENSDACVNAIGVAQCVNARCGDGYLRTGVEDCDDGNNTNGDGCSSTCTNEGCGNGILETVRGEQCDDHNTIGGDGCSSTCQLEDCGDGFMDVGEECDGNNMGVGGESATCNVDCTLVRCGDGKINNAAMEQCDDGTVAGVNQNQNNRDCRADCRLNFCTDGFQNTQGSVPKREACDDGNQVNNDGCSNACQLASCGNGLVDPLEECDLGMTGNSDTGACTTGCKIATCGDGKIRTGVEDCDPGEASLNAAGPCLPGVGATHQGGCRFARCGDGDMQASSVPPSNTGTFAEACDNGEQNGATACQYGANSCQLCTGSCALTAGTTARCGDGISNGTGSNPEACDRGVNNGVTECAYGQTGAQCELCSTTCTVMTDRLHVCGDGIRDNGQSWGGSETCDDGNITSETQADCNTYNTSCLFCNATCSGTLPFTGPRCGDGTCQPSGGGVPGANETNANCPIDCASVCGNNVRENNEQCDNDTAPPSPNDGCSATCTVEFGYTCTGAQGSASTCTTTCGDGKKAAEEACDDGNTNNGDGCSMSCAVESGFTCTAPQGSFSTCTRDFNCGDGAIGTGEMCDNMGFNNGTACISNDMNPAYGTTCLACNSSCMLVVSVGPRCGDSVCNGSETAATCSDCPTTCGDNLATGNEPCDGSDLNGQSCTTLGFTGGTLTCSSCAFNINACTPRCGNGTREATEQCDTADFGGATCATIDPAFDHGTLSCSASCSFVSTNCSECGDNIKNGTEECDGPEGTPGTGTVCPVMGETGATCNANCQLNTNACN